MQLTEYSAFTIPGQVSVEEGKGGLPVIRVRNTCAQADIYLHGAHVTHFEPTGGKPLLWLSDASPFVTGKAIRGGIPVCFPWFGPHKTNKDFPVHGIARFRSWTLQSVATLSDGRTRVVLALSSSDETRSFWPHDFLLELAVVVGPSLELELTAYNTDSEPFLYEDCLHTYFSVGDVTKTSVSGLDGVGYIDRTRSDARSVQTGPVVPSCETVNAYMQAPSRTELADTAGDRKIIMEQNGFKSTVVWTPWEATAAKNPEMVDRWRGFLCVEGANCLDANVVLLPGTSHRSYIKYTTEKIPALS